MSKPRVLNGQDNQSPKNFPEGENTEEGHQFSVQRLYVKDISYEAPGVPAIFQHEWQPQLHLDIRTQAKILKTNVYEVVLILTVKVNNQEELAFLVEVEQAGVFSILGLDDENLDHALKSFCPNFLYPYARETVTNLVNRGSFPQLILAPINFDALYSQHLEETKNRDQQNTHKANDFLDSDRDTHH